MRAVSAIVVAFLVFAGSACGNLGGLGQKVDIVADNASFEPAALTLEAKSYLLAVQNVGDTDHNLTLIRDTQPVGSTGSIRPGSTASLPVDLTAGTYYFACKLADFELRGMKGTLTVS